MNHRPPSRLTYAVDESPSQATTAFLGFQAVLLMISGIALTPVIVLRATGQATPGATAWVVFAALLLSGITTALQGRPIWKFGSGYPLFMGTSGAFIAVGIAAIQQGGLPLLGTLAATSAFIQFFFAARLYWFRKLITAEVGGVVVMLIVVTVFPIGTDLLNEAPEGKEGFPVAVTAGVTFFSIVGLALFGKGWLRLWGPIVGIVLGCAVGAVMGLFEVTEIKAAPWVGFPAREWPGMDLSFGKAYWTLLPGFIIVTIIGAIETYGDAISIQRVSHREPQPINFKTVQNALYNDGLGNLLAGMMGTLPNTTYSNSISLVEFTGVAARRVAVYGGAVFVALAFMPKVSALLQAIPSTVVGVYLIVLLSILFISGLRLVTENGLDYDRGIVVSLSFWLGVAFQNQVIFPELMPAWLHSILDNGMTAGGVTAIALSAALSWKNRGGSVIRFSLAANVFDLSRRFIEKQGRQAKWDEQSIKRLQLVCEEALLYLKGQAGHASDQIRLELKFDNDVAGLELTTSLDTLNIGGRIQSLDLVTDDPVHEVELRILRGLAEKVEHQQFSGRSFLSLEVRKVD